MKDMNNEDYVAALAASKKAGEDKVEVKTYIVKVISVPSGQAVELKEKKEFDV